ncbi:OLC1v1002001C1 [Oldenlandia corymbosa var. corymbosa]|uniref:OLC1v1002001C1 n=1 Tax=Oldenlandia corymbosa var. corymbosa TaxID=529605 RepID=A0AAV1D6U0_OLDCO|nr:OLC1v1002001C1 [Oldenlandia corymbosa var. corymbosa]
MSRGGRDAVERRLLHLLHGHKTRNRLPEIHGHLLRHHLHHSNKLISHFVSICGSFNKMHYADLIFQQFQCPNILLFNSMIKGYSLCGPFENSLNVFITMKKNGIWPDEFTLAPLLKACSNLGHLSLGQTVQKQGLVLGFQRFGSVRIGLVELYSNCGRMEDARKVFDEMSSRDVIVWNLMVRGYCRIGKVEVGFQMFREMDERNIVSWNTMIACFAESGRYKDALGLFNEMRNGGIEPDEATVVTILPVCRRLGEVDLGRWIHSLAQSNGLLENFVSVSNALVDFYCKSGDLESAFLVFRSTHKKNVISWNTMIAGLAWNGKGELGVGLFDEMINEGVSPNDSTFVGVLACCVHAGLLQRGRDLFQSMLEKHAVEPKYEHYGSMVDLLGRYGCLREAFDLIQTMPIKPNSALWGALLSACQTHGHTEIAECAVKELISLEPGNSGNYVLLSNIYAERGDWDEVEKVRLSMRENNVKKSAGQSVVR